MKPSTYLENSKDCFENTNLNSYENLSMCIPNVFQIMDFHNFGNYTEYGPSIYVYFDNFASLCGKYNLCLLVSVKQ